MIGGLSVPPLPMVISVADLLVRHLRRAGVDCIFGVPGGGGNLDLIDAAGRAALPFVLTATETGAALAAVAQAEINGRPGVCLTTLGPGVTSVVNGVACAWLDRAPLLVCCDSHPDSAAAFDHQRVDHRALLNSVIKWSVRLTADNAEVAMREAIDRAMTEPRGPVLIECPGGVLAAGVMDDRSAEAFAVQDDNRPAEAVAVPDKLGSIVSGARRPLLLVGLCARRSGDAQAIVDLCTRHRVPAMVTYKAKGVVPDSAPFFAGVLTNGALERPLIAQADLLIGVGLDPVELLPRPWSYEQTIVHIGRSTVSAAHVPFAAQLVTDVPSGMRLLDERLSQTTWDLDAIGRSVIEQHQRLCPPMPSLPAHRVVQIAADAAADARVTVDAGAHMFPATMLWPVSRPNGMLISNGLSTMGFALPAAIGAALAGSGGAPGATPDREMSVVALTGDGGLLMCCGELLTAVREHLRIVIIVFADASLSLIDIKQRQRDLPSAGVALGAVDWCALAESFGAAAHRVRTESDLTDAMARASTHRGPTLIEALIDPAPYSQTLHTIRG
jgi:acetolactate synthase I/II/III large subunit